VQRITYRPEHDAVLRGLRGRPVRTVLDIGCGTGLLAARVRREFPAVRVTGCDFSPGMLAQAAAEGRADALVRGSALALPFAEARFDAVISTEAFHWFPDQEQALREFRRVLVPGGPLLLSFVNPPLDLMSRAGHWLSSRLGEPARWPTRERLREMVERAGLRVESQRIVLRVPATFVLPSVLTVAMRPEGVRQDPVPATAPARPPARDGPSSPRCP